MTSYLAVHHPVDPTAPKFDFWSWRIQRRAVASRLRALAEVEGADRERLGTIADRFEDERLGPDERDALAEYLEARQAPSPDQVDELLVTLDELLDRHDLEGEPVWQVPIIRPDWEAIPLHRPTFAGKLNGVTLRARLPRTRERVPPYELIWIGRDGRESDPMPILGRAIGQNLSYARPVWDWLFARRLTLLCMSEASQWPDPERPPVLWNGPWEAPGLPL